MCVPLLEQGNLLGIIYVGNDNVAHLFEESHLEVLTIFAAQASLLIRNALLVNELKLDNRSLQEQLERDALRRHHRLLRRRCRRCSARSQKVAATDISRADHRRDRHRQGADRARDPQPPHARQGARSSPSTAAPSPRTCWSASCSATCAAPSPARSRTRPGKFQAANGGTLFLDEIGEMPLALQVKLLRALQERVVVRVGDTNAEPVDIRVRGRDQPRPRERDQAGRFREDLYYRLNVVNIHLPPLRDRGDDMLVLAQYLLQPLRAGVRQHGQGLHAATR